MTDTPPPVPPDMGFPDGWADRPLYPSSMFGGTREEMWTPRQTGSLFIGWALINDGLTVLKDLLDTPTDSELADRTSVIALAAEWLDTCAEWSKDYAGGVEDGTDRSGFLDNTTQNMIFLADSMQEHVHRLGTQQQQ